MFAPTLYTNRHDNLCKYIHILLSKKYNLLNDEPQWYQYDPKPVLEDTNTKILWNFPIQTDHSINHNKPDIIIFEKIKKHVFIIDIAIPNDFNIICKHTEKIQKYTNLKFELKQIWDVKTVKIVPVIIGATGLIHEGFSEINNVLDININIKEAQKIVILGTVQVTRSFFSN